MDKGRYKSAMTRKTSRKKSTTRSNQIFSFFSYIADYMIVKSPLLYALIMFIETFHLLYLPIVSLPNQNHSLQLFVRVITWLNYPKALLNTNSYQSWLIFSGLWVVHGAFAVIIIGSLVALFLLVRKSAHKQKRLLGCLSGFSSLGIILLQTVILLPIIEIFIYPALCSDGRNLLEGDEALPPYLACGTIPQIVISGVGILLTIVLSLIFFFSSSILIEDYYFSPLPWAGESRDMFILQALAKYATYLYIAVDVNYYYLQYAVIAAMGFYCWILYETIWSTRLVCSRLVLLAYNLQASFLFTTHAYSCAHLLYSSDSTLLTVCLVLLLGLVIGIFIHTQGEMKKQALVFKDHAQLKLMKNAEEYTRSLCSLTIYGRKTAFWRTMFRNVLRIHYQECPDAELCICKKLILNPDQETKLPDSSKEQGEDAMRLIGIVLENEANKWKQSRKIMLEACYYQTIIMKNYFKAYYWIMNSENARGGFCELFLQYRMKHILAQSIIMKESKNQGADQIKVVIKFQEHCTFLQNMLQETTEAISGFWKLFESPRLNVNELFTMAQKISVMLKKVSGLFKKCTELSPNYPYIYYYYGHFIRLVLNNLEEATDYIEKGEEILRQVKENKYKYHQDISTSPDTAVLIVSGNVKTLGTILYANKHVKEQLGFTITDLEGRNVSRLMPGMIGEKHDELMLRHYKTGESYVLGQEHLLFIQTKDGLIEPVCIIVKTLPSIEKGIRYVGFIRQDLTKTRNSYVKIPSQYKRKPLCFLLTDENGNITGISKKACSLFGLTPKYIMRKKGFTSQPFPIGKLAPELESPAFEKQLQSGMLLTLNTSAVLDYLDYDFLKRTEEQLVYSSVKENKTAYVVMMKSTYQSLLTVKVFAMVNLSGIKIKNPKLKRMISITSSEQTYILDPALENNSPTGNEILGALRQDSVEVPTKSKSKYHLVQTESNGRSHHDSLSQSTSVKRLKGIILLSIVVTLLIMVGDFTLYRIFLGQAENANKVIRFSHRRAVHFNMVIHKVISHLNNANELESPDVLLTNGADQYLVSFKTNEFIFEKNMVESYISFLDNKVVSPTVKAKKILSNYQVYNEENALNSVIYELVGEASQILQSSADQVKSKSYKNGFYKKSVDDSLASFERGLYFFIVNSLGEPHSILAGSGRKLHEKIKEGFEIRIKVLFWVHVGAYSVIVLFGIMFVPILLNIQRNKRQLLISFAELSVGEVTKLSASCQEYLKLFLTDDVHESHNESDSSINSDDSDKKPANEESPQPQNNYTEETEKDEEELRPVFKEKNTCEKDTVKERKKGIQNVSVSLGYVSLVICGIFIAVLGYYSKILWSLFTSHNDINNVFDSLLIVHQRFLCLSSAFLFYRSYLKSFTRFHYQVQNNTAYEYFLEEALRNEDMMKAYKTYPSKIFAPIAKTLKTYDGPEFCGAVQHLFKNVTQGWCATVLKGLLKEGLSASVSFFLTRVRYRYITISLSRDVWEMKLKEMMDTEFMDMLKVLMNVYNVVFEDLEDIADNRMKQYMSRTKTLVTLDYVIMFAIIMASFVIMFSYFVKSIESEISTERGILTILPTDTFKKVKKEGNGEFSLEKGSASNGKKQRIIRLIIIQQPAYE
eukprot:TRINITY_DN105111_c0_g1_i1.p1 TRINITY_DN105111_c0_g1~~TRINITY_DN105111_c0_g1_i1.p1  ORF type:complete len:1610 (-),score=154.05 TRINITY_DN105111_c0_g1_i1:76-4905(-)